MALKISIQLTSLLLTSTTLEGCLLNTAPSELYFLTRDQVLYSHAPNGLYFLTLNRFSSPYFAHHSNELRRWTTRVSLATDMRRFAKGWTWCQQNRSALALQSSDISRRFWFANYGIRRSESRRKGLKKRFVDQFNGHSSDDNTPINESRGGFETHRSDDNTPRDEPACDDLNSNVDDSNRSDRKRQAPDDPLHVLPLQPALKRAKVNEKEPTSHDTLQYEGHQFTWKDDCKK